MGNVKGVRKDPQSDFTMYYLNFPILFIIFKLALLDQRYPWMAIPEPALGQPKT